MRQLLSMMTSFTHTVVKAEGRDILIDPAFINRIILFSWFVSIVCIWIWTMMVLGLFTFTFS
jgi:hypothetical protein